MPQKHKNGSEVPILRPDNFESPGCHINIFGFNDSQPSIEQIAKKKFMWYPGLQSQLPPKLWKKHLLYVEKLSIMAEALGLHECTLLSLFLKTLDFEKLKKNSCDLVVISLFYITKIKDISENIVLITNFLLTFCTIWRQKKT